MKKELKPILSLVKELKKTSKTAPSPPPQLNQSEQEIFHSIQERTQELNRNNITRTQAYFNFYLRHPEIHWSFLAHMVSRNAGWSMTDLKGEWLPHLLHHEEAKDFFLFLERGNWLIFQDAFPQLLLYEEGVKRKSNFSSLLPHFQVSRFMQTVWDYFDKTKDSHILTTALIINEQNYIESRIIANSHYQEQVLSSIQFKLQDVLSLNQILFPYLMEKQIKRVPGLLGQTLQNFGSLNERIRFGKRLYYILFQTHRKSVEDWAYQNPHTGSRKDYWFHIFSDVKDSIPGMPYKRRIENCRLRNRALRVYSPRLTQVWKDIQHEEAEREDWYQDWKTAYNFIDKKEILHSIIEETYCNTLEKIDLAVLAQEAVFPTDS